ncbi:MAG: transporter substrate-binding domain-containing protein [Desulfobacteraceae bacterium]
MKRFAICLLLLSVIIVGNANAQTLTIYTEEFPPFNFTEKGKITGVSTEIVRHVMADTGIQYRIQSLSWKETYQRAQEEPNSLIFSISRNKSREKLFKWIGIIVPTSYFVMALKSRTDIKVESLADMKKYKIGTTMDDIVESWLISKGFDTGDFYRSSGDNATQKNFMNLLNKKIDVCPFPDAVAYHIVRKAGHANPGLLLQKTFPIEELSGGYHMAAGLKTPDSVVFQISQALRRFKQSDDYYKILAHWGVDATGVKTDAPITKLVYALKNFNRIVKIGYIAADKMSAHRNGGLYRKEMHKEFQEAYVNTFDQWRKQYQKMQNSVDALIIGDITGIKGWNDTKAQNLVQASTKIPTGCLSGAICNYAIFGFDGDDFVINKKIADSISKTIPRSYIKKANRIIE